MKNSSLWRLVRNVNGPVDILLDIEKKSLVLICFTVASTKCQDVILFHKSWSVTVPWIFLLKFDLSPWIRACWWLYGRWGRRKWKGKVPGFERKVLDMPNDMEIKLIVLGKKGDWKRINKENFSHHFCSNNEEWKKI